MSGQTVPHLFPLQLTITVVVDHLIELLDLFSSDLVRFMLHPMKVIIGLHEQAELGRVKHQVIVHVHYFEQFAVDAFKLRLLDSFGDLLFLERGETAFTLCLLGSSFEVVSFLIVFGVGVEFHVHLLQGSADLELHASKEVEVGGLQQLFNLIRANLHELKLVNQHEKEVCLAA